MNDLSKSTRYCEDYASIRNFVCPFPIVGLSVGLGIARYAFPLDGAIILECHGREESESFHERPHEDPGCTRTPLLTLACASVVFPYGQQDGRPHWAGSHMDMYCTPVL